MALRPPGARPPWPELLVFGLGILLVLPAWWDWARAPATALLANPFTGGHVWSADLVADALWAGRWPDPTDQAGFPGMRQARFVAWPVLLAATLLRPLWSAHAVVHLASWLGPALGGVAMVRLGRALSPQGSATGRIAAGVLFALAPVTLGAALSGQVENTQTWVLPLLLLLTFRATTSPWLLLLAPPAWALGALTSPYLAMLAAFASPWPAWLAWREGRASAWRCLAPLLLALPGLLAVSAWLDLGAFSAAETLYRPSYAADGWPPLDSRPLPVAALDTLLIGRTTAQVKAMVLHQPYLGLVPLLAALLLGAERRRWLPVALLGALLALGPRLAWNDALVTLGDRSLVMPAQVVRWLHLPLAHGGQYYRAALLASLGLAGCLAAARWRPGRGAALVVLLSLLGAADSLRSVRHFGLPWPTWSLPTQAWSQLSDLPPGAVLNLPMHSTQLPPCHPVRLAGRRWHGRAVSDLPRAWTEPPEAPLLERAWEASLATPTDRMPTRADLAAAGFAVAVLDLPAIPERRGLQERLVAAWGPPDGHEDGLSWWRLAP